MELPPLQLQQEISYKVEPGFNLLEEFWFFQNLLTNTKPSMSTSNSDPFPSTIAKSLSSSTNKGNNFVPPNLVRAPSLPTSFMLAKGVEAIQQNGGGLDYSGEIIMSELPPHTLLRAPSLPLPPCLGSQEDDDDDDQESEFKMGRLIRQASLNSSQTLPPRQTKSCMPRRPRKKVIMEEMGQQYQIKHRKKGKMPSDLQEAERLKSLSSKLEKQSLDDDVSSRLQEKSWGEEEERRRYHLSDTSSSTTIQKWKAENEKRLQQDMKAQIKFWARAVASNARAPGVS